MSIAYESEPQHPEVIDMNAERTRLRTELNTNPETVVTLPVAYEFATPISQQEIESFRSADAEIALRHESTREDLAAIDNKITLLHERDVKEVDESKADAERQYERMIKDHELEFDRRVRAARELMFRGIQNDAYALDVKKSMNDNKLHASERFVQATEAAIHQTTTAVEGGATVRQQHIERRESLISYINVMIDRYNDRANQVTLAEGRIVVLDEELAEDEGEKEHLYRQGKKLRAKDTKIRTLMAESDPRTIGLRNQIQLNEESENIKEIFSNIRAEQSSDELDRIIGDLENNAEAIRSVGRSIAAKHRAREADELIIENATVELRVLADALMEAKAKFDHEMETVAPQLEKQSVAVLSRTAILKAMVGGNTTHLAKKDSYVVLKPVEEAMHGYREALALQSEKYVRDTNRPAAYMPDEELPYIETLDAQADLNHAEQRFVTSDSISETFRALEKVDVIKSAVGRAYDVVDIAKNGFIKNGQRMHFLKQNSTKE
jgi:hypothetical protein